MYRLLTSVKSQLVSFISASSSSASDNGDLPSQDAAGGTTDSYEAGTLVEQYSKYLEIFSDSREISKDLEILHSFLLQQSVNRNGET